MSWRAGVLVSSIAFSGSASAEIVDAELRGNVFIEPSSSSKLTVINPTLSVAALPTDWLSIAAGYEADIVSGASEAVKAGPLGGVDVVSAATPFDDTRHTGKGAIVVTRESTELSAEYAYGTESDYRSQSITVSAATTFLQKNIELRLSYGRGFDRVCTSRYAQSDAASARAPLDSSEGCFTSAQDRRSQDLDLDSFQVGWTQNLSPVMTVQLVLTASLQHGFLGNPYRGVVIAPAGDIALENHPVNRARAAAAVRTRYYLRSLKTALGLGALLYRDTWALLAQAYELDAERYLVPGLRLRARARYYSQTGALFFSDDYTGGEPVTGPRGQYWTGDRELSPLSSLLLGGHLVFAESASADARLLGTLLSASASLGVDAMSTELESFTWAGKTPDDTLALLLSLGLGGKF